MVRLSTCLSRPFVLGNQSNSTDEGSERFGAASESWSWEHLWRSRWSWKLQDRLFINCKSSCLSDSFGEAFVNRIGDPKSFWIVATCYGSQFQGFQQQVHRGCGAFRGWNRRDGWSLDLKSRFFNHSTNCFAACSSW